MIDVAILYFTESLLLSPLWFANMFIDILRHLALALVMRSMASQEPEDAFYAAKYLRHLRDPAYTPLAIRRQEITVLLVVALSLHTKLKANDSDVVQTFEEMAVLTHELLTSDPSSACSTSVISVLSMTLDYNPLSFPNQLLNQIIECLRLARIHKPDNGEVQFLLAIYTYFRGISGGMNHELDEAVSIVDEIIASSSPGDELVAICHEFLAAIAEIRLMNNNPEVSEELIYRARAFLSSSSADDALCSTWNHVLECAARNRFENFGPIDGLEPSSSSGPLPTDMIEETPDNSITNLEEAIASGRRSTLASSGPRDFQSSYEFGEILFEAFERTENIKYLNESIHILGQLLARRPSDAPELLRFMAGSLLLIALITRSGISPGHYIQDWQEVVALIPRLLDYISQWWSLPQRFEAACLWAYLALHTQHPSTSTAFETALSWISDISLFSPTLQLQHATLTRLSPDNREIPLAYASHLVDRGQLEQAIETLERGRALLWSEMRHLRTSVDQLLHADPELGHKFTVLNRDLEELTKSIAPSHKLSREYVLADDLRAGDQFGSILRRQRKLLKARDELLSQIRALPGFDRFLLFPLFDTLRSAASSGPVIIVNLSELRSDILILLHNASPSLIPTPTDFYERAIALKDKLLDSRVKDGLDSSKYDRTLASVLAELYELVGKPVIDRLRQLQVPDQSRIWWCPTSVFCSLPLHAMGPLPSDDGERRYFLDLYICSYTPSLTALIQSRNRDSGSRSSDHPSVLLVAQPDPSLPTVGGEIQVVQALDTEVTSLISDKATPAAVLDGFHHHRFVHFACHGTLEENKPFEAGFELHGNKRLTLLEIVRADLPTAEFAFLSACHTAEVTEGSIMDEGLHLAAAVQYSGFRSVVGTMWAMADVDGRDLAVNFYKALFSNSRRDQGTPYHERSAKALRFAVKKLRRKRHMTLERWVNFVHYGA